METLTRKEFRDFKEDLRETLYKEIGKDCLSATNLVTLEEKDWDSDIYFAKVNWWCEGAQEPERARQMASYLIKASEIADKINSEGGIKVE